MSTAIEPRTDSPTGAAGRHTPDLRVRRAKEMKLVELDPRLVIDGEITRQVPLKLVLRHKHVIRSHLYCDQCTRCYDAVLANGRSALALTGLSID